MRAGPGARLALLGAVAAAVAWVAGHSSWAPAPGRPAPLASASVVPAPRPGPAADGSSGCLRCHEGLETMHPWAPLTCVECHGGNAQATTAERAHVRPRIGWPRDERVLHPSFDPDAVRFRNPSDLRVAETTCGRCHAEMVSRLLESLHGTTAGHLNDGLYENGVLEERGSVYGVFGVRDEDGEIGEHGLPGLLPIERLRVDPGPDDSIGAHFADLPRKACMQCHLWSEGFALRGRLGMDGLYRGAGCAACHVPYAEDGLSRSGDPTIDRFEPGHPRRHAMVTTPPVTTCTSCHVGDASIGNAFRGLAQLYPRMPAGPEIPGTTDRPIARQFFVRDPVLAPPDLHHTAGMSCVDCHTGRDVMGDGDVHGAMEHAVEIECTSCHGTFTEPTTLRTARGARLPHLRRAGPSVVLTGKRDGVARRVVQARDVLDPDHPDHSPAAARAMTREHEHLECYACHAGWNTNFFGFHFDRNESFTQLDLIEGRRTKGRVTTQERVFATLRRLTLGIGPEGRIAPYMVGFSTMGTVRDEDGELLLDQALPQTAAGLSGMSMIHHQTHTTLPTARSCVECHRSPTTWGLGSGNASYSLARGLLVGVGESGVQTMLLDREAPARTVLLARLPLGGARRVVLDADRIDGHASTAFVVVERAGVAVVDVGNPAFPSVRAFISAGDARDVELVGDLLVIANGVGGVRLVDVADRDEPELLSDVVTTEARGVTVQWPRVLVADGGGGLAIVDVGAPRIPRLVSRLRVAPDVAQVDGDARQVQAVFQYARPQGHAPRTRARMVAVIANGRFGYATVDVTEPERPFVLASRVPRYLGGTPVVDVSVISRFDLGDTSGRRPTLERDVAYLTYAREADGDRPPRGQLVVVDVTDATDPVRLADVAVPQATPRGAAVAISFNPPRLVTRVAVATDAGLELLDASTSESPRAEARLLGPGALSDVAVEAFAFDQMVDATGRVLKDVSHEGARYLTLPEIHRVLSVPGEAIGTLRDPGGRAGGRDLSMDGGDASLSYDLTDPDDEDRLEMLSRLRRGFPIAERESLARLVRHVDPRDGDGNGDGALGRGELERIVYAVLDANGDGVLGPLEWPRDPGADPPGRDEDDDGRVERWEFELDDNTFAFFDVDDDGLAGLDEWPFVVDERPVPTLRHATVEALRRLLRMPGLDDEREALLAPLLAGRSPGDVPDEDLARAIDEAVGRQAYATAPPGFVARHDLDGDGAVERDELSVFERVAARCDLDGDGEIDDHDRP